MTTVPNDGIAVAAGPVLDWIVTLNSATGLVEWLPVLLLAGGMLWLSYATRPGAAETLNARSEREVEEARR